jgi:8-oxo-dGTP pyrophosphatase MutT (NUDIX family)/GNAT superfamily N-acetyltransferase/proteasome lid subunit RPN8/RPN11
MSDDHLIVDQFELSVLDDIWASGSVAKAVSSCGANTGPGGHRFGKDNTCSKGSGGDGKEKGDSPEEFLLGKRSGSTEVLGARLYRDIDAGKSVSLLGEKVESVEDLTSLVQVYRDPRYETFRAVMVKDGEVVGHNAYSSRMPSVVSLPEEFQDQMTGDADSLGADSVYLVHNHPSGDPTPSPEDLLFTEKIANQFGDKFKSHVVINHNKAVEIKRDKSLVEHEVSNEDLHKPRKGDVPHELLGEKILSSKKVAEMSLKVGAVKDDRAVVVMTEAKGTVRVILDVHKDTLQEPNNSKTFGAIRRISRKTSAGGHRFVVLPKGVDDKFYKFLIEEAIVTDVIVSGSDDSLRGRTGIGPIKKDPSDYDEGAVVLREHAAEKVDKEQQDLFETEKQGRLFKSLVKSVGGVVVELTVDPKNDEKLWVNTSERGSKDTCAIYVENNSIAKQIKVGDSLWWQGQFAMWTPSEVRESDEGDSDIEIPRIGFSGVSKPKSSQAIKVAGLAVLAEDTGRVLMLQRAITDDDPASGAWEFPGGHLEDGETPFQGAAREWMEETGHLLPKGLESGTWNGRNKIYRGIVYKIPSESDVHLNLDVDQKQVFNPDDPDGDQIETVAWWSIDQITDHPALRQELRDDILRVRRAIKQSSKMKSGRFWLAIESVLKGCGANAPGGGGFQIGNDCARGGGTSVEEKPDAKQESKSLAQRVANDGGFTYNPTDGDSPTEGFSIAVYPEHEQILSAEDATPAKIAAYMIEKSSIYSTDERIHIGAWFNKKTDENPNGDDKVYLDLSMVIDDRDEAVKFAKENGQLGIFDLKNFQTIETLTPDERKKWEDENKTKSYAHTGQSRYVPQGHQKSVGRFIRSDPWEKSNGRRDEGNGRYDSRENVRVVEFKSIVIGSTESEGSVFNDNGQRVTLVEWDNFTPIFRRADGSEFAGAVDWTTVGDDGSRVSTSDKKSYHCPDCDAEEETRERRANGNSTCKNGHVYPSSFSIMKSSCGANTGAGGRGFGKGNDCATGDGGKEPEYKDQKLIRYTHKGGGGLLNNSGLDRMKLSDEEEFELVDMMDFGLQQPPSGTKGVFYFSPEGEKKHARMLELLGKASKRGIVRTEITYTGTPNWVSNDGQFAINPKNAKSYEYSESGSSDKKKAIEERLKVTTDQAIEMSGVEALQKIDPDGKTSVYYGMGPSIHIEFSGEKVGAVRAIRSDGELLNWSMAVKKEHQGQGFGAKVIASQVDAARKAGMKKITMAAGRGDDLVGYKVWPLLGFDGAIPEHAPELPKRDTWPDEFKGYEKISDFMKSKSGRDWWEENGTTVDLEMDLDKDSLGSKVFAAYRDKKGI